MIVLAVHQAVRSAVRRRQSLHGIGAVRRVPVAGGGGMILPEQFTHVGDSGRSAPASAIRRLIERFAPRPMRD